MQEPLTFLSKTTSPLPDSVCMACGTKVIGIRSKLVCPKCHVIQENCCGS